MSPFERVVTRRRAGSLCAVLVTLAGLTACGGSKSPTSPSTPPPVAAAAKTYSTQNPLGSATNVEARTSQVVPQTGAGVPTAQVFDDFTFTDGANIRTVSWQGIYCYETANAPAPVPSATGFIVAFYPDQGGQPNRNAVLFSTTVPIAQANETLDRTQSDLKCGNQPSTWSFYSYSVTLPSTFGAAPKTKYWLSIQAMTATFAPFWGWRDGIPDNRLSLQFVNGSNMLTFPVDRAYLLAQ